MDRLKFFCKYFYAKFLTFFIQMGCFIQISWIIQIGFFTQFSLQNTAWATMPASAQDFYRNFSELFKNNLEGLDYRIRLTDNQSQVAILAIHGGRIEIGTSEIATAIAQARPCNHVSGQCAETKNALAQGACTCMSDQCEVRTIESLVENKNHQIQEMSTCSDFNSNSDFNLYRDYKSCRDYNLYLFEGMRDRENYQLHITSENFDEPRAIELVENSYFALSIHGFKNDQKELVCIGGKNRRAAQIIANLLKESRIDVEYPCEKFKGENAQNIVNKSKSYGVQLELSHKLRINLLNNQRKLTEFGETIRNGIEQHLEN